MLSRTAANLYWIGRYFERAEFAVLAAIPRLGRQGESLGICAAEDAT